MYSELVKDLRRCSSGDETCESCKRIDTIACEPILMSEAADAIEYLMRKLETREAALNSVAERLGDSTVAAADVLDTTEDRIG